MGSYWRREAAAGRDPARPLKPWHPPMVYPEVPPQLKELMRQADENLKTALYISPQPASPPLVKQLLDDAFERIKEQHREDFGRHPRAVNSTDIPDALKPVIRSGEIWCGGTLADLTARELELLESGERSIDDDDEGDRMLDSLIAEVRRRRLHDSVCDFRHPFRDKPGG